jgi:hypothetical protein
LALIQSYGEAVNTLTGVAVCGDLLLKNVEP